MCEREGVNICNEERKKKGDKETQGNFTATKRKRGGKRKKEILKERGSKRERERERER